MALERGAPLPEDLTVVDAGGRRGALPVRRGEAALLIFLRHLA